MDDIRLTFLTKVLECIVKDTSIEYIDIDGGFPTPFFKVNNTFFIHKIFLKKDLPGPSFKEYCENSYGLNELDTIYVWEIYRLIIENRIVIDGRLKMWYNE